MDVELLVFIRLRAESCGKLCVGLLIFIRASWRIELFWNFSRGQDGMLERVQAFFLIERDGKQNRFHGVVARLIGGRLRVGPHAPEQAIEIGRGDVVAIGGDNFGVTADNVTIRFVTDNPGPWFLHWQVLSFY